MFSVPRHSRAVLEEWSSHLADHLQVPEENILSGGIGAVAFPPDAITLRLVDGSSVPFNSAFAIVDESRGEIVVFTEHCGYHVFPSYDATVYRNRILVYRNDPDSPSAL